MNETGTRTNQLADADHLRSMLVRWLAIGGEDDPSAARRRRRHDDVGATHDRALLELYQTIVDALVPAALLAPAAAFSRDEIAFAGHYAERQYRKLLAISASAELGQPRRAGLVVLAVADVAIRAAAMVHILRVTNAACALSTSLRAYEIRPSGRSHNAFRDWVHARAKRLKRDRQELGEKPPRGLGKKVRDRTFARGAPSILTSKSADRIAKWLAGPDAPGVARARTRLDVRLALGAAHLEHTLRTSVDDTTRREWEGAFLSMYQTTRRALRRVSRDDAALAFMLGLPALRDTALGGVVRTLTPTRSRSELLDALLALALAEPNMVWIARFVSLRASGLSDAQLLDRELADAAGMAIDDGALDVARSLLEFVSESAATERSVVLARARLMLESGQPRTAVPLLKELFEACPLTPGVASTYRKALDANGEKRRAAAVSREMRRHGLLGDGQDRT